MAKNYILYQAYGNKDILNEAIFSMLTFQALKNRPEVVFVIYTDDAAHFMGRVPAGTQFETLNAEILKAWKGPTDFVHRVKVEMIKDFFTRYDGNLLYMDTDTTFLSDPSPIFENIENGGVYMHICEGKLDTTKNLVFKKLVKFIKGKTFELPDKTKHIIASDVYMWNAGVLGFNKSVLTKVDEVLMLTDVLHKQYNRFVMEQFAFSIVFQKNYDIKPVSTYIFHYWNFKEFRSVINDFLKQFNAAEYEELVSLSSNILVQELIKAKLSFEALPGWNKKIKKIFKLKTWELPAYKFWAK